MKNITIIGGGLSGLAASCYLAQKGLNVTIIDKNKDMGGRLSYFKEEGFTFDLGPSWYWMPDIFDNFFNDFNKKVEDYYDLVRLDPSYKFFFKNKQINMPSKYNNVLEIFDQNEPNSSHKLNKFIKRGENKYKISMSGFIELPNLSLREYVSYSVLKNIFSLDFIISLRKHIKYYFKNKNLKRMLEFPSMFLGGTPDNTPALYSLMNYADIKGGTWYPKGGMFQITKAFVTLSKELGVKHINDTEIKKLEINNNGIIKKALGSNGDEYKSDIFICCAEYPFVQQKLIDKKYRSYSSEYWEKRDVAPSALIFYLGISEKIKNIEHHNLFFDKNFDKHLDDIFKLKIWPKEPLFYACCPSKTDPSTVPNKEYENLFILIPIGPGSEDNKKIREEYFKKIIDRIEEKTNQKISDKIIVKKSFCINDFKDRYNAYKGNAYGLANTLLQTAIFKPKIKDLKVKNLYYTGHFTVPGPGLPPAIISGKIASKQIIKDIKNEIHI